MKEYTKTESGESYTIDGMNIPNAEGNRHYRLMLEEVESGEAEILPYVIPEVTSAQLISELEASITSLNLRGAALGDEYSLSKIADVEGQINALR